MIKLKFFNMFSSGKTFLNAVPVFYCILAEEIAEIYFLAGYSDAGKINQPLIQVFDKNSVF